MAGERWWGDDTYTTDTTDTPLPPRRGRLQLFVRGPHQPHGVETGRWTREVSACAAEQENYGDPGVRGGRGPIGEPCQCKAFISSAVEPAIPRVEFEARIDRK